MRRDGTSRGLIQGEQGLTNKSTTKREQKGIILEFKKIAQIEGWLSRW